MLFFKKPKEDSECRYCQHVAENDGNYECKYKGRVSPGGSCGRYKFDPFAKRVKRRRVLDTSFFDPLDFKI